MKRLLNIFICSLLLAGNHLAGQTSNLIFEAKFENTLDSEEVESATLDSGLSFEAGVSGMGVLIEEGDVLQYAVQNNIDVSAGSMTLWVRPNWDPGDLLYRILVLGKDQRNFELHMDEGRNLAFSVNTFQLEGNPIKVAFADGSDWKKDNWYFLTYTWSADEIAIFVNGNKVGQTAVGFDIPVLSDDDFLLGSLEGEQAFNGTVDELRIYDAPLSAEAVRSRYEAYLEALPTGNAISVIDIFDRDVTAGLSLVDWEGPVRNPALKYFLQGNDELTYPVTIELSTREELASFNLPSRVSRQGASKSLDITSPDELTSFLFSIYMDEDFEEDFFDLQLRYPVDGLLRQQIIPVRVIDQDRDRPLSYPVIVDFSEARDFLMEEHVQAVVRQAAEDWLYYVDGTGIDPVPAGGSFLDIGGNDHFFEEKRVENPVAYNGYYLYAYESTWDGTGVEGCPCSTGFPNRELLQTKEGEVAPIFRIGGLHLNLFGQGNLDGWAVLSPFDNWTLEGLASEEGVKADLYFLAKHEIGHAMVFEESPLYKEAQERLGFVSPALTEYYQDTIVPLLPWSTAHLFGLIDPASQSTPYGGGVDEPVMPLGREMLTKLDILIMESVGYPIRDNGVTRPLSLSADNAFTGALDTTFEVNLLAQGGIPVYHYEIIEGVLPAGLVMDSRTGKISGTPQETGMFPVTFMVKDYDERSTGALLEATINTTEMTTGLDDIPVSQNLTIYPNPSTGTFAIVMDNDLKGSMDFIIFDPTGKQMHKITRNKTISSWEETIDLGSLNSGIYLIEVRYRQNSETYKLIVK